MIFGRKAKKEKEKEEVREVMTDFVKEMCFELVAQEHMAAKSDIFTPEEFQGMVDAFFEEAEDYFMDMDAGEILEERMENQVKRLPENVKIIEVQV